MSPLHRCKTQDQVFSFHMGCACDLDSFLERAAGKDVNHDCVVSIWMMGCVRASEGNPCCDAFVEGNNNTQSHELQRVGQ